MGLFDGIDDAQAERIRKEITREARQDLVEELRASIRADIERDVRSQAREQYAAEIRARAPSPEDREAFVSLVKEIQLDALAQAHIASADADTAQAALARSRRYATPAAHVLTIVAPLVLWITASATGGVGAAFYAVGLTFALLLVTVLFGNVQRHMRLEGAVRSGNKMASDFMVIAERAKAYRMVHAERLESAEKLNALLEDLRRDKERLDEQHHVSVAALASARTALRQRVEDLGSAAGATSPDRDEADELDHADDEPDVERRTRR